MLVLCFIAGCGGGGGGTVNPVVNPTAVIQSTPTQPGTSPGNGLGKSGYVYKNSSSQIIILASNSNPPAGFTPAQGVTVRYAKNPSLIQRTDSSGYFNFGTTLSETGNLNNIDLIVESPSIPPASYPVLEGSMPASGLTDLRIIPPYDDTAASWTMKAGDVETFYVAGKSGSKWYTVSDEITWAVSNNEAGYFSILPGFFTASSAGTGQITATVNNRTLSLNLTVVSGNSVGTVDGYVKNLAGSPVLYAIVEAESSSGNYSYSMAMTDAQGYYKLYDLPYGAYNLKVSVHYGQTAAQTNLSVQGAVRQDFTVSSEVSSSLNAMVYTDEPAYDPGETIKAQVGIINIGNESVNLQYTGIKFDLVKENLYTGEELVINTVTSSGGTANIPSIGNVSIPSTPVNLTIPADADIYSYYYVKATVMSGQTVKVEPAFITLGSYVPYVTPVPGTTPTPVPGGNEDYERLKVIKSGLNNLYYDIYSQADKAYYGEDVKNYVDYYSDIQYDIRYIRDELMPSLDTVTYHWWQNDLNNVISDLNAYAENGGTYNDLYNAASKITYIKDEVADAEYNLTPASLKKKKQVNGER